MASPNCKPNSREGCCCRCKLRLNHWRRDKLTISDRNNEHVGYVCVRLEGEAERISEHGPGCSMIDELDYEIWKSGRDDG